MQVYNRYDSEVGYVVTSIGSIRANSREVGYVRGMENKEEDEKLAGGAALLLLLAPGMKTEPKRSYQTPPKPC